jgi:O-antigen ligase
LNPLNNKVLTKTNLLLAVEWFCLAFGVSLLTLTEQYQLSVTIGFVFLMISFAVRAWRTRSWLTRTGLEIPWALFLISALVAVWASPDRTVALLQFFRFFAAFVIYYAVVNSSRTFLHWLAFGFLVAAAILAIYWPLQHDFTAQPGKIALITSIGTWINSFLPPIPGPTIHNNVAAGVLVLAVPFGIASIFANFKPRVLMGILSILLTLIVLAGLLMTSSRGGWLALFVTGVLAVLVVVQRSRFSTPGKQAGFWLVCLGLGIVLIVLLVSTLGLDRLIGKIPDPTGSLQSRQELWKQGWALIQDAPFSGHGLMSFWDVHGIYGLLIQTPILHHAHNTFIEIWLEQGILGITAVLITLLVIAGWWWKALSRKEVLLWGWTGLAAITAASLHGLVDVVFYIERTLPVIGMILGYTWLLNTNPETFKVAQPNQARKIPIWVVAGAVVGLLIVILLFRKPLLSAWYANLGALEQQRIELNQYDPAQFEKTSLDQVRQTSDLTPAVQYFQKSLVHDSNNRTALQRMTEISLSRGEYETGLEYIQTLWDHSDRAEITRLLYADAHVANFQDTIGADAVRGLDWAEYRLMGQAWYRYWIYGDYPRAASAWSAVVKLNPENTEAQKWLKNALEKNQ